MRRFTDRTEAGRELAALLHSYAHDPDVVVLGLPRGGMLVAREVAEALEAPLDVLPVQRLAIAGTDEYAIGAVGPGGLRTIDWRTADVLRLSTLAIEALIARKSEELERREQMYRAVKAPVDVSGRTVVLVDDGIVSGTTMTTAIAAARRSSAARVVVASPIASREAQDAMRRLADAAVFVYTPARLFDIALWYEEFPPVSDGEIVRLLRLTNHSGAMAGA